MMGRVGGKCGAIFAAVSLWLCAGLFAIPAFAGSVSLEWTNPIPTTDQGTATGNRVYRSTDTVACDNVTTPLPMLLQTLTTAPASATYTDTSVPNVNGKVCYEITAYNAGGESGRSNRVSAVTTVNPPPAPTGLVIR